MELVQEEEKVGGKTARTGFVALSNYGFRNVMLVEGVVKWKKTEFGSKESGLNRG